MNERDFAECKETKPKKGVNSIKKWKRNEFEKPNIMNVKTIIFSM